MITIKLNKATHIYAQPGTVTVSEAEAARLCAIGVAEPVTQAEPVPAPEPKKAKKTAK